jgi:basic membrane protein A and related proteins
MQKRTLLKWSSAVVLAAGLAACGKQEPPKPAAAPTPAPAPAAAPAPKAADPLKIGFIYVGPVGDAGWTFAHDNGRKAIEKEFGDKIKTTFVEKVPEGADAERTIRDLVAQGNKLIFATSFGYGDAMAKVAKDHPEVKFEHATGFKTSENLRVYEGNFYEDAYMAGVVAGHMSKSKTIGFVASFPIPEVIRNINAFTLGARSVDPKIKTKVVWISTWFDPPKEAEAAQTLINGGADVLLQNTDSTAVLQTAEKNGKYAFGWDSDMSAFAPKAHLASAIVDWAPYYKKAVKDVLENTWKTGSTKWGVKEDTNALIKMNDVVPEPAKKKVDEIKAGLKAGTFNVYVGPLKDNAGKERLAAGAASDDKFRSTMDFYVEGVEGSIPAGK